MARHYEGSTQAGNDQPTIGEDAAPDELSIGEAGCEEQLGDSMDTARVSSSVDGCGKDRNYANALGYGELGRDFGHSVVHGHGKPAPATCAPLTGSWAETLVILLFMATGNRPQRRALFLWLAGKRVKVNVSAFQLQL